MQALAALEYCGAEDILGLWLEESPVSPHEYVRDQARHNVARLS